MLPTLVKDLNKKVLKITSLKILILNSIENENYELLSTSSIAFIKETERALNKFMKYEVENKNSFFSYFEIKNAKNSLFKILTCIISLMTRITNLISENKLSRMNYIRYLEGERRLEQLRENYIYILRKQLKP